MSDLIDKIIKSVDEVPSLPTSVSKILEVTQSPIVSPNDLNRVISLDPVLTGKVLKLVNSAYYSLSTKVTSIVKGIILLGINTIRNLALTTAVVPLVGSHAKKSWMVLHAEGYWKHSIGAGVTAKLVAKKLLVDKKMREEYFISGLLHDIGKVILDHTIQEEYLAVIKRSEEEQTNLITVETEMLKINHAEVGRMLAEKWKLSDGLTEAISLHHNPKDCRSENRQLVYAVAIANIYCNQNKIGFSGNTFASPMDPELLSSLNLSEEDFDDWSNTILDEINKASIFMNIQ